MRYSELIRRAVENFFDQRWESKDFLTEDDVRCRLFCWLKDKIAHSQPLTIHSEVRWYGVGGRLKYRSDLVIIDYNDLEVRDGTFRLPSKGYGFNRFYAIIEVKLRRINDGNSDSKYETIINKDIEKLRIIRENTIGSGFSDVYTVILIFDKKRERRLLLEVNEDSESEIYFSWREWSLGGKECEEWI